MNQALQINDGWDDDVLEPLDDFDPYLSRIDKEDNHPFENMTEEEVYSGLHDKWWRLNHLYYIVDKFGRRVLFRPNEEQTRFYRNMWFMNLILKARQRGFTTLVDISFLDDAVFYANIEAGIIAHNREDVSKIFRRKILYPYENLPEIIKTAIPTITKSKTEIEFKNNSIISVGTSMRSGTLNRLHISEFGKVCARFPEKAREIVTGAFEAIHTQTKEAVFTIESTAEGKGGYFYDYCKEAQDILRLGRKPTLMEFRFHFFPWWDNTENELQTPVPITENMSKYFQETEAKIGQEFRPAQKYWYVMKWKVLGEDMKRENPSTPEEAFEQAIKGAYFSTQFVKIREEKRICSVPHQPGATVRTWWDLGMNDVMAIWFSQDIGREIHMINYYENSGEGFDFYKKEVLDKTPYSFSNHNAPFDISVRELGTPGGADRWTSARKIGINFNKIPKTKSKIDSINAARRILSVCWFDEEQCAKGISRLENYRKEWNEHLESYKNTPLHDINSNGADAFQTMAMGHGWVVSMGAAVQIRKESSKGWT